MKLMQLYVKIHLAYKYKYQNAKQLLYKTTIKKNCGFLICLTSLKNQLTKCFKKYVLFACKEFWMKFMQLYVLIVMIKKLPWIENG